MISRAACHASFSALGLSRGVATRAGIAAEPWWAAISRQASFSSTSPSRGWAPAPVLRLSGTMRGVEPPVWAERVHVAAKPCILSHVRRGLDAGQAAEGRAGHEQEDLGDLARGGVDERHRRPRPVDLKNPAGPVPDAAHDLPPRRELAVALAEAVVGHEGLALRPLPVAALLVRPPERGPDPGELAVRALPVGVRAGVPVADLLGEGRGAGLRVRHPLGLRPAGPRRLGGPGRRLDAVLRHSLRPRDRVSRHARPERSQDLPGPDLPRHVLPPSLSVAWRAERRRRRCRTGIRLVPNGNIGRWTVRCRIAIPRVLTGAITQQTTFSIQAGRKWADRPLASQLAGRAEHHFGARPFLCFGLLVGALRLCGTAKGSSLKRFELYDFVFYHHFVYFPVAVHLEPVHFVEAHGPVYDG